MGTRFEGVCGKVMELIRSDTSRVPVPACGGDHLPFCSVPLVGVEHTDHSNGETPDPKSGGAESSAISGDSLGSDPSIDSELARIVEALLRLPEETRETIFANVRAASKPSENPPGNADIS
jgi:hypothetical protein